jgi:hypothetical protein
LELASETSAENDTTESEAAEPPTDEVTAEVAESAANEPEEPPAEPTVAARPPAEKRASSARSRSGGEWFAHQGKYIAIGFALALIGTIYLARSNRGGHSPSAEQPHAHPGEAGQQFAANDPQPATVVGEASDSAAADSGASGAGETSPAKLADASPPEPASQANLHAPRIPQIVHEPESSGQPDNKDLFPWAEQPGDRLATRPEVPVNSAPAAPQDPQAQYPVTAASAPLLPPYPTTATPNSSFAAPTQQQPHQSSATSDYRSYVPPVQPSFQPPAAGQPFVPAPAGPGSPYMPSDNSARGYRYERTGSGPY